MESSRAVNHTAVVALCLYLDLDSAVMQFLSWHLWSLPCPDPSKVLGVPPPSPMHTHPTKELFSAPTAQTFGSAHFSFGRSMVQAGEEAGDN